MGEEATQKVSQNPGLSFCPRRSHWVASIVDERTGVFAFVKFHSRGKEKTLCAPRAKERVSRRVCGPQRLDCQEEMPAKC